MPTYVSNVTLFDGKTVKQRAGVLVDDGRVAWVGAHARAPRSARGADEIDGRGKTLTPGLIDCHVHLCFDGGADFAGESREMTSDAVATVKAVRNAARTLDHGVTTVRDLGGRGDSVIQVARRRRARSRRRTQDPRGRPRAHDHGRPRPQRRVRARGRRTRRPAARGARGDPRRRDGDQAGRDRRRADAGDHPRLHGVHAGGARRRRRRGALVGPRRRRARDRSRGHHPGGPRRGRLDRARLDALGRGGPADEGARYVPRADDLGDPRHRRPRRRGAGVRGREGDGARRARARGVPAFAPRRREDRVRDRRRDAVQPARQHAGRDRPHGRVGDDPAPGDARGDLERGRAAAARRRRRGRRGRGRGSGAVRLEPARGHPRRCSNPPSCSRAARSWPARPPRHVPRSSPQVLSLPVPTLLGTKEDR